MNIQEKIKQYGNEKKLPDKIVAIFKDFCAKYQEIVIKQENGEEKEKILFTYLDLIYEQVKNPFPFAPFHASHTSPVDYYSFSLNFFRPLIDFSHSKVLGKEYIETMMRQVANKENVIFLANHQIEPDPQIISLLLEKEFPEFAKNMIFVAGDRVTTDPLAVPFSMGCNLICIYSKKYLDVVPELKEQKLQHNQKAMQVLKNLLSEGGKCIYVAPSGGRDRVNAKGVVEAAPFDPQSIELFALIAQQAAKPTHFYPLALSTYWLLPPPKTVDIEIGEIRNPSYCPVHLAFGKELDMEDFPGNTIKDKKLRRQMRAEHIWKIVNHQYSNLTENNHA